MGHHRGSSSQAAAAAAPDQHVQTLMQAFWAARTPSRPTSHFQAVSRPAQGPHILPTLLQACCGCVDCVAAWHWRPRQPCAAGLLPCLDMPGWVLQPAKVLVMSTQGELKQTSDAVCLECQRSLSSPASAS